MSADGEKGGPPDSSQTAALDLGALGRDHPLHREQLNAAVDREATQELSMEALGLTPPVGLADEAPVSRTEPGFPILDAQQRLDQQRSPDSVTGVIAQPDIDDEPIHEDDERTEWLVEDVHESPPTPRIETEGDEDDPPTQRPSELVESSPFEDHIDDDDATTNERRRTTTALLNIEIDRTDEFHQDDEPSIDELPRAVRPIGRLAGDGWGLALDYKGPQQPEPSPILRKDTPPEQSDEAALLEGWLAAQLRGQSEADRLERWLSAQTLVHHEADRLEVWLHQTLAGPRGAASSSVSSDSPVTPVLDAVPPTEGLPPHTQARVAAEDAPLPFAGQKIGLPPAVDNADPSHVDRVPMTRAAPSVVTSARLPWEGDGELPLKIAITGKASSEPEPQQEQVEQKRPEPKLPLDKYAAVKVAIWDDGKRLLEALAQQDIDEMDWRANEEEQAELIQNEAFDGASDLAMRIRHAIEQERARRKTSASESDVDLLALDEYARLRAAIEPLEDEFQIHDRLLVENMSLEDWQAQRDGWTQRLRHDKKLARTLRKALSKARKERAQGGQVSSEGTAS